MDITLQFRPVGSRVLISVNDVPAGTIDWSAAKERAIELKVAAQSSADRVVYAMRTDGRPLAMDLERSVALRVSAALHHAGAVAEESAVAEQVAMDQALLIRINAPFGLTADQRIADMAWTEAQWNSDLRRTPLKGVPSRAQFGVPTVTALPKETLQ